jgi:hypothetical protein
MEFGKSSSRLQVAATAGVAALVPIPNAMHDTQHKVAGRTATLRTTKARPTSKQNGAPVTAKTAKTIMRMAKAGWIFRDHWDPSSHE